MTMTRRRISTLATAALAASIVPALADDKAVVTAFYTDLLNSSGPKDKAAVAARVLSPGWKSFGDYSGTANSRDGLVKMLGGFHQLMPDLTWAIEEMLQTGNRYIVRGRAKGTPKGPLFGVDGKGKGFTIMSIDIHTVKDGVIVESYHVEDWAGALRQLAAK